MKNNIVVSVEFSFKGKKYSPSMVVSLDEHIQSGGGLTGGKLDALYPLLATSNAIDHYSYEYEIMLAEDLAFSDATGLAANFLEEGKFDLAAFKQALQEETIAEALSKIAKDHLSVDDLSSQPGLKAALLKAYKLGQSK